MILEQAHASFWNNKEEENISYIIQFTIPRTTDLRSQIKTRFKEWAITGVGYDPNIDADIFLYSKEYSSEAEFKKFLKKTKINEILSLREAN